MFGQRIDAIKRQSQRLADVADGAAGSIRNHRRRQPGSVTAIFLIEVLKHFLAAFVFEIDIDVGGFVALFADESFEQQIRCFRINRRYTEAVADG